MIQGMSQVMIKGAILSPFKRKKNNPCRVAWSKTLESLKMSLSEKDEKKTL